MLVALAWVLVSPVHAFESCTPQNNYLERLLPAPVAQIKTDLPRACVTAAQKGFPDRGVYGFCPGDTGRVTRSRPRPCLSEAYVASVHNAIADVAECLDFDPKLAFATFNLESGVHLNAVGPAGDAGVGQLTKPAIEEVNRREFDRTRAQVAQSNSAACRRILPFLKKATGDVAHRCAFISAPANPVRNVAYSIMLIEHNQRAIDHFWSRLKARVPDAVDLERLKERMTMLAYNAGAAGSAAVTAAYVRLIGAKLSDNDLNFENRAPRSLHAFVANHFPVKGARRKRVAGYLPALIGAARRTEERASVACFDAKLFPRARASFVGDDEAPDFASGEDLVNQMMVELADDFTPSRPAFTCAEAQAEFLRTFLPPDAGEDELPDALRARYDQLCGG